MAMPGGTTPKRTAGILAPKVISVFRLIGQNLGALLGFAGVAVLWLGLQHAASSERHQALLGASQSTANLARAFEEHIIRSLKAVDQSILYIRQAYARNPQGFDVVSWARDTQSLTDMTFQISRIDRNGILASSNFAPNGKGIDLSDREHFRVHRDSPSDVLFVSKPLLGRASNKWSIQLTRKVIAQDGSFDGVIVVSLDPFTLSRFYNAVDLGHAGLIVLTGTDGVIRAGASSNEAGGEVGRSIQGGGLMAAFQRQWAGTLIGPSSIDGVRRVESFRGVSGYPLFVCVGIGEDDVLATSRANLWSDTLVAVVLTVLLMAVTGLIVWRQVVLSRARRELRASQAQYAGKSRLLETTLEAMSQGILMVDAQRLTQVCNQRAADLLGLAHAVRPGEPIPEAMAATIDALDMLMPSPDYPAQRDGAAALPELVQEMRLDSGVVLEVRTRALPEGSRVQTYTDITARAAAEEMLEAAAGLDHLTGLANRRGFSAKLDQALLSAQRNDFAISVLCLDLDQFKRVNDTKGHEAGDALLRMVSKRMRDALRDTDVIARLGGDEFAVVIGQHGKDGATRVAQILVEALAVPFVLRGGPVQIGTSIGIATFPDDGHTAEQLLGNADLALYQAKAAGRNGWRAYSSGGARRERERKQTEQDLQHALLMNQFTLLYQPICDARPGDLQINGAADCVPIGFEALLRWIHPERGMISPIEFLAVAEDMGLSVPLQDWVIETACAEAAGWPGALSIAINVAAPWLAAGAAAARVASILRRTGLPAERLSLEVTETALLKAGDEAVEAVTSFRRMGVRLTLDDFGLRSASLGHLGEFRLDQVKIDRSFMRALSNDRQARALVEAMLAIAHARGLSVVAEGVETIEQLSMLRHMKCDLVQGFLLGHPQEAACIPEMLAQRAMPAHAALERRRSDGFQPDADPDSASALA